MQSTIPILLALTAIATGQAAQRYALVLQDPPIAEIQDPAAAKLHRQKLNQTHQTLRQTLATRHIPVTGATQTLANAIYIQASPENLPTLRALPGVRYIQPLQRLHRAMDKALPLINAPAAWTALGGPTKAGAGIRIAILDTGIDPQNPAFQDPSLTPPTGYPVCAGDDCNYATNKIIAVRSYVQNLVYAFPDNTRPDDLSARDRVGHGTAAAMIAAGVPLTSGGINISGVAPKAFLGNYKIYGSPGINDYTYDDVVIQALTDAFDDGFDVASLSTTRPAAWAAADSGATCGNNPGVPCDLLTDAVALATRRGMIVVVSAGNDGATGGQSPTLNTINTPASAPTAIAVGATTNAHSFYASVTAGAQTISALMGRDGPRLSSPLTAPLRDVATLNDDGRACAPLTSGSLNAAIALILRGECSYETKVNNAQGAGAVAVVVYNVDGDDSIVPPFSVQQTSIPMAFLGNTDGRSLKTLLATSPNTPATVNPSLTAFESTPDQIAYFSSEGPNIGDSSIKPDLVSVGTDIWVATQRLDVNGDLYSPTGFTSTQGTSFAAPMAAGAAALVRQNRPTLTVAQVKSALVNTGSAGVMDYDANNQPIPARAIAAGGGKLNVGEALKANVAFDPASVSFGSVTKVPLSKTITVYNTGNASVTLAFTITQRDDDSLAKVAVTPATLTLAAGRSGTLTLQLTGGVSFPGIYEGVVNVKGAATAIHIPYMYIVTDGAPADAFPLVGDGFIALPTKRPNIPYLLMKIIDSYGLPVPNVPVQFQSLNGGAVDSTTSLTDNLGIAQATIFAGPNVGEQTFTGEGDGILVEFNGKTIPELSIRDGGVVNAASGTAGAGLAPGSYISIFGSGLSDVLRTESTASLPISLAKVSVGFDVLGSRESYPGHIHFVSPGQVNVQVPWELQGKPSAALKVIIGDFSTQPYTLQLSPYSPAFFEYPEQASGKLMIAALDENFRLLGSANPALRGRPIQIYANGLGPVDVPQISGEPAPSAEPLGRTVVTPTVSIGASQAQVLFSGLAPGFVGLYQLNVIIPADAPVGIQPISVSMNGVVSKVSTVMVQ